MTDSAQGYDVSNYQGRYNWAGTSGLSFGICRATEGLGGSGMNSPDPELAWNWTEIKKKGLARGAYHFLHPDLNGTDQANYFVDTLRRQGLETTDMLWLDNESSGNLRNLPPTAVSAAARDFLGQVKKLCPDNPSGVYANPSYIQEGYCAGLGGYPLWLAAYGLRDAPATPAPWTKWIFWQWAPGQQVQASPNPTPDKDAFNGDAAQLRAWIQSFQPRRKVEEEVQSGQLNNGAHALTIITVPWGSGTNIAFGCDNGVQNLPPAVLRVAVYDTEWHVTENIRVDSTKGQTIITFPHPAKTGIVSVARQDSGQVIVGYEVS